MAEHTWPAGLPCFQLSGFSTGGGDGNQKRSEFPGGTKVRRRFTGRPPKPVTASLVCTPAQLQTVEDFYWVTLRETEAFNHRDMTKPNDTTLVEYCFLRPPRATTHRTGRRFLVTLELEQLTFFQGTFPLGDGGGSLLGDGAGSTLTT